MAGNRILLLAMAVFLCSLVFFVSLANHGAPDVEVAQKGNKKPIASMRKVEKSDDLSKDMGSGLVDAPFGSPDDSGSKSLKFQACRLQIKTLKKRQATLEKKLSEKTGVHVSHIQREELAPAPDHSTGQITDESQFGKALKKLAQQKDIKLFLELGTFYGEGSTECIAKGMMVSDDPDKMLYTLDIYEPCWAYARQQLLKYPVRCILGTSVGPSGFLKESEIEPVYLDDHFHMFYERDIKLAAEMEPMLEPLCQAHQFDAVLMDGNEYTGLAEYEIIDKLCKPKYIAWKGVGSLKTKVVEKRVEQDPNWKLYQEGQDAVGWVIYKHTKNSRR